jgi:hypothetical protein
MSLSSILSSVSEPLLMSSRSGTYTGILPYEGEAIEHVISFSYSLPCPIICFQVLALQSIRSVFGGDDKPDDDTMDKFAILHRFVCVLLEGSHASLSPRTILRINGVGFPGMFCRHWLRPDISSFGVESFPVTKSGNET